jgi:hypothetical protein
MAKDTAALFRGAFDKYVNSFGGHYDPGEGYLTYDFKFIHGRNWWSMAGEQLIEDELRELTNILNSWHSKLVRWHVWNSIIKNYKEEEAWELQHEFLESLAHHCLVQPSSIRDTFTFIATNAFHQVLLSYDRNYKDRLEGDPKIPNEQPSYLTRRQKEKRLKKLLSQWAESKAFINALANINDKEYQNSTSNYRNRVNHAIAPRLGIGITQMITRKVVQATEMVEQPDKKYLPMPVPGKLCVRYGFGGTNPIDYENARILNLRQYEIARKCYFEYLGLLKFGMQYIAEIKD